MDLDALSSAAFAALRLAYNDIWTQPDARFRITDERVRGELEAAQVLAMDGAYCRLTREGLAACKATFGALIEKELAAQELGSVLRVPFKGR